MHEFIPDAIYYESKVHEYELGRKLLEKYKNTEIAIAAYNAGIGTVDKWIEKGIIKPDGSDIENIPYKETNNYVRKTLRNYKIYQDLYK